MVSGLTYLYEHDTSYMTVKVWSHISTILVAHYFEPDQIEFRNLEGST